MALPDSYAGVIAALKEQSGSTKFYKPSFQGIIEAIKDLGGAGGSIDVLPPGSGEPDAGNDGDMVAIPNGDDNYFLYVYADGGWQKIHVTTEEVETIGSAPFVEIDGLSFDNQSQINQYIWEHLQEIEAKGYDDSALWADQARQDDELNQHIQWAEKGQDAQDDRIAELDSWIKGDQSRQDDEFIKGQAAQDQALENYKQEVADDQIRQDQEFAKDQAQQNDAWAQEQADQDDAFVKGQATQDDIYSKGQAAQDKALQDEIDARANRDLQHDAQIETIEYKLDALLGLQFRGAYRFDIDVDCETKLLECYAAAAGDITAQTQCNKDHVACEQGKVNAGEFEALDPGGQFDQLLAIVVHLTDLSGVETEWGNVLDVGDYLEIDHQIGGTADKTNYGLYRIKAEPESTQNALGETVYSFELEFLQGNGDMLQGEIYEIRGINKDQGVNPEELADFLTKEEAMKTYLPFIGGELTGTLKMADANVIQTRHLDSGQNSDLLIKRNNERRVVIGTDKIVFDKPPEYGGTISADSQLVNKKYVDNNSSSGDKGAKGNRGYTGSKGSAGSTGATGYVKMKRGTSTSPTLASGEMYWNYSNYTIYVGK